MYNVVCNHPYSPWKKLSKVVSIITIKDDLTSKIIKKVKFGKHLGKNFGDS
jgi:hypothetical protein